MKNSFTTIKNKQTNKTKQQQIRNNVIATSSTKAQSEAKIKPVLNRFQSHSRERKSSPCAIYSKKLNCFKVDHKLGKHSRRKLTIDPRKIRAGSNQQRFRGGQSSRTDGLFWSNALMNRVKNCTKSHAWTSHERTSIEQGASLIWRTYLLPLKSDCWLPDDQHREQH